MFLKRIIFFSLLTTIIISCAEYARIREESARMKRERGYECIDYGDGSRQCDYILPER